MLIWRMETGFVPWNLGTSEDQSYTVALDESPDPEGPYSLQSIPWWARASSHPKKVMVWNGQKGGWDHVPRAPCAGTGALPEMALPKKHLTSS